MMAMWTGLKQLHTTSNDKIGPNKEVHLAFKIVIRKEKLNLNGNQPTSRILCSMF